MVQDGMGPDPGAWGCMGVAQRLIPVHGARQAVWGARAQSWHVEPGRGKMGH